MRLRGSEATLYPDLHISDATVPASFSLGGDKLCSGRQGKHGLTKPAMLHMRLSRSRGVGMSRPKETAGHSFSWPFPRAKWPIRLASNNSPG